MEEMGFTLLVCYAILSPVPHSIAVLTYIAPVHLPLACFQPHNTKLHFPELRLKNFQRSIVLSIFLWPSLSLAVTSLWGGPESSDKREYIAGTLIDLLSEEENKEVEADWIETILLQFMSDEFEVNVDDGSAMEVANGIVKCREECKRGAWEEESSLCRKLEKAWEAKGGKSDSLAQFQQGEDQGETDSEASGDEDEDGDVDMDEAPQLVRVKEPVVPQVDEDGFTMVTKKRR